MTLIYLVWGWGSRGLFVWRWVLLYDTLQYHCMHVVSWSLSSCLVLIIYSSRSLIISTLIKVPICHMQRSWDINMYMYKWWLPLGLGLGWLRKIDLLNFHVWPIVTFCTCMWDVCVHLQWCSFTYSTCVSVENRLVVDTISLYMTVYAGGYKDHWQDSVEPRQLAEGNG